MLTGVWLIIISWVVLMPVWLRVLGTILGTLTIIEWLFNHSQISHLFEDFDD